MAQARPRNRATGVTGLLLHSEGLFPQLLEGARAAVHELCHGRIAHDPRHHRLHLLAAGPLLVGRTFPGWHTAFLRATPASAAALGGHLGPAAAADFLAARAPRMSPVLLRLLHQFVGRWAQGAARRWR
ncbi:hypothetical protein HNP98_004092 [Hymenobacter sp. 9A]|uniref:BLUF domain-containing protein n=1 Tax=Hymenobacter caeli TaxID=2735894 RepID=A0ABX2FXS1_9BACT|nr:hypothetical protein [Hymenobacter caeli]